MYQFESAAHEAAYRAALAAEAVQHISGRIFDASGAELVVDEDTIVDTPTIDSRCLENEDVFNIAEMYVGELNMRIKNDTIRTVELIGGEVRLAFAVDTTLGRITVPLGVWDIIDAKRDDVHFIDIVGHDRMGRLAVSTDHDQEVGVVSLLNMLSIISEKANVQFAQTAAEILTMAVPGVYGSCTKWEMTCWEEVRLIAQMIGGFAFANRDGKIEFKKFQNYSTASSLRIPANRRFRAELKEQAFGIRQVTYTDTYGKTYEAHTTVSHRTASVICIPRNKWIWTAPDYASAESYYADICLDYIYRLDFNVVPGSIEFYGDPTIDLGDIVVLTGGIGEDAKFLVTGNFWQFRAPQTLTCGGPPSVGETVTASSSAGAGATAVPSGNVVTKTINAAALAPYVGALFPNTRTVARARFGCKDGTNIFLNCNLTIMGTDTSTIAVAVYLDGDIQNISPRTTAHKGRYTTVSFAYNVLVKDGVHDINIKASGVSELVEVNGYVYGQNITAEKLTYSNDYTYAISDNAATVTGYTGISEHIEIPEELGGADVTVIGGTAFADNNTITTAYIPDGVQEIADSGPGIITMEQTGTLPLTFDADGTDLIDWSITGAAGGVGKLGKNYLKQTEITLPSGSYGERVFTTSSWIPGRTSSFNSGQATTIGFNLHKSDNSNITPANVGKMYIVEGDGDPETEGVELVIFQGGISPKGDDNNPSIYHLMRYGDDGYGNTQQFMTGQDAAYIPIRCGTALLEIKPNTTYTFARVGGDNDVEIQFTTGKGTRTVSVEYVDTGVPAIPDGGETTVEEAQWCRMTASEHYYSVRNGGQIPIDNRAECYDNCTAFANLPAGHYKVIAEAIIKDASKQKTVLYGDDVPYFMLINEDNNKVINKTQIFVTTTLWNHEEYDFTLTAATKVGLFAKAYFSGGTALVRFMVVDYDTVAVPFDIVTTYGQLTGSSCWEPYSAILPLTITSGASSTTVTIELTHLLYADDTISLSSTSVSIPTYAGSNTLAADTDVQPSEVRIKYHEPVESTGAFMYAANLAYVNIPESVVLIGRNAFTNTSLTDVRISRDCTYYPTSFPEGCHIWYYGDEPTPDNYYTAEQVNDLLSALDARVTALEET